MSNIYELACSCGSFRTSNWPEFQKHTAVCWQKQCPPVNKPTHYNTGKIEVIDFIEDQGLNFNLGNTVKYISRAGKKDPEKLVEDLEKALWYIQREIKRVSK